MPPPPPFIFFFFLPSPTRYIFEYRGLTENWTAEMTTHHKRTNLSREKRVGQRKGRLKGSITCKFSSMNPSRKLFQFCAEVHSGEQLNEHPSTHFFSFFFMDDSITSRNNESEKYTREAGEKFLSFSFRQLTFPKVEKDALTKINNFRHLLVLCRFLPHFSPIKFSF